MEILDNLPENIEKNILKAMIKVNIGNDMEGIKNLISKIGIDEDQKAMFWRAVLSQLSDKREKIDEENINHPLPVRSTDYENISSLIAYIQGLCDSKDEVSQENEKILTSKLYNILKSEVNETSEDKYWNEAITELIKKIVDLLEVYSQDNDNTTIFENLEEEEIMTIGNLRNGDAAKDFDGEPWVEPEKNIDDKSYSEIRNKDKILDILNNSNKLDKTFNKDNENQQENKQSFISLIMPRYGRRVEVEDLDRNFWVIANLVDGMSSWLLEKSPFNDVIYKLIDETVKLWENILYLWLQIVLISQKKSDENLNLCSNIKMIDTEELLRYENIPVVSCKLKEDETFDIKVAKFKFMEEEVDLSRNSCPNPLSEYEASYSEQDLCYIEKIKIDNYRKNYYSGEWFKEVVFSLLDEVSNNEETSSKRKRDIYQIKENYGTDEEKLRDLVISLNPNCEVFDLILEEKSNDTDGINEEGPVYKKVKRFSSKILSASYHSGKFFIGYPFEETGSYLVEKNRETMYCGLRAIPNIKIERDKNGKKIIKDFKIYIYDAINSIFAENNNQKNIRLIGTYETERIEDGTIIVKYNPNKNIGRPYIIDIADNKDVFAKYTLLEVKWEDVDFSYYLGEGISWRERTSRITEIQDIVQEPVMLKIGNFLPEGQWDKETRVAPPVPELTMLTLPGGYASQIRGDFTFQRIPTLYGYPLKADYSYSTEDISNVIEPPKDVPYPSDYSTDSYGENDGTSGKLFFYYFDWNTYLPEKDIPGSILGGRAKTNTSIKDDFCFETFNSGEYHKICGNELTEDIVLDLGKQAIANYLINTSLTEGHPHNSYYKKPLTFITLIGMAPTLRIGNCIQFDSNVVCHIIKYLPHPDNLESKDGKLGNYKKIYDSFGQDGEFNDGKKNMGKVIASSFINKYDSYYDEEDFQHMLNSEGQLYTGENEKIRGLLFKKITDNNNYCKCITINDSINEYKINFDKSFIADVQYYDFKKAAEDQVLESLLNYNTNTYYQISSGITLFKENETQQIEDGVIRPLNGKTLISRKNDTSIILKESDVKNTGLLAINSILENKKMIPFINGQLIDKDNLTPATFGAWKENDVLYNAEYAVSPQDEVIIPIITHPITVPDEDEEGRISSINLPSWIIVSKVIADIDKEGTLPEIIQEAISGESVNCFDCLYITYDGSSLNAYRDFYNSLKDKDNPYLYENTVVYDSLSYKYEGINISSDMRYYILILREIKTNKIINLSVSNGYYYGRNSSVLYYYNTIQPRQVNYSDNDNILCISVNKDNNLYMDLKKLYQDINLADIPQYCYLVRKGTYDGQIENGEAIKYRLAYRYNKNDRKTCTEEAIKQLYQKDIKVLDSNEISNVIFSDNSFIKEIIDNNGDKIKLYYFNEDETQIIGDNSLIPEKKIYYNYISKKVCFRRDYYPPNYYVVYSRSYEAFSPGNYITPMIKFEREANYENEAYYSIYDYGINNNLVLNEILYTDGASADVPLIGPKSYSSKYYISSVYSITYDSTINKFYFTFDHPQQYIYSSFTVKQGIGDWNNRAENYNIYENNLHHNAVNYKGGSIDPNVRTEMINFLRKSYRDDVPWKDVPDLFYEKYGEDYPDLTISEMKTYS